MRIRIPSIPLVSVFPNEGCGPFLAKPVKNSCTKELTTSKLPIQTGIWIYCTYYGMHYILVNLDNTPNAKLHK